jgi:membrane fusion protein, heavy metal efflux system
MNSATGDGEAGASAGASAGRCRVLLMGSLLLAAGALLTGCSARGAESPTPGADQQARDVTLTTQQRRQIQLFQIREATFRRTVETSALVDYDADQATSVLAPFSGPVTRLLVRLGERVRAGAALANVDSPDYAAAISSYRKALATARTARQLANLEEDLLRHRDIAPREAAQALTDAVNAEADRDAALQALYALHVDPRTLQAIQQGHPTSMADGVIRSPIAGTVVERLITPGQLLQAGTTACFTVADLSRVWVLAQLFGADVDAVRRGDPAQVMTGLGGRTFAGTVTNVSDIVDQTTRSVIARITVDNPQGLLKKQMYVRVLIQSRQPQTGLLVPVSAILRDDDNLPFVYVSQPDGSFARAHVTLGERVADDYDISAGVHPGDQVVVDGAIFLQFIQNQ